MSEGLSKMKATPLTRKLLDMLNELHGGNFSNRLDEIRKERGKPKVQQSNFSRLDNVSMQLLIETLERLKSQRVEVISRTVEGLCSNNVQVVIHLHRGVIFSTAVFKNADKAKKYRDDQVIAEYGELVERQEGDDTIDLQECQVIV